MQKLWRWRSVVSPSIVSSGNFAELNGTVTCMVLKANDRRTSCPCHDEFRGPRSDYVRQIFESNGCQVRNPDDFRLVRHIPIEHGFEDWRGHGQQNPVPHILLRRRGRAHDERHIAQGCVLEEGRSPLQNFLALHDDWSLWLPK
ncbi:hypothetical protein TNCV_1410051 [Trichonephila clavipes]|nr:hypothetical protein TNCV_1410051 [Trichonephila clavipes]